MVFLTVEPKNKKKIILRGLYNLHNFGDDLLLISNVEFLNKNLGLTNKNLELYTTSYQKSILKLNYDSPLKLLDSVEIGNLIVDTNQWLKKYHIPLHIPSMRDLIIAVFVEKKSAKEKIKNILKFLFLLLVFLMNIGLYKIFKKAFLFKHYLNFVDNLDLLHYLGGGYFNDKWREIIIYEFLTVFLAKMINPKLKVIGTGLGLGPLNNQFNKMIFKKFIEKFDYIFVRENESLKLLEELKLDIPKKVLGDDTMLLVPHFTKICNDCHSNRSKVTALNLKDFPDHDYSLIAKNIERYIKFQESQDRTTEYFCFGVKPGPDDYRLLDYLDSSYRENLVVHNPYEEGWINFLRNLARVDIGLGLAYHFNVLLCLLNIPTIGIYSGEYYKQKIEGVIKLFDEDIMVMSLDSFKSINCDNADDIVKISAKRDENKLKKQVEIMQRNMNLEYLKAYENVLDLHFKSPDSCKILEEEKKICN